MYQSPELAQDEMVDRSAGRDIGGNEGILDIKIDH